MKTLMEILKNKKILIATKSNAIKNELPKDLKANLIYFDNKNNAILFNKIITPSLCLKK